MNEAKVEKWSVWCGVICNVRPCRVKKSSGNGNSSTFVAWNEFFWFFYHVQWTATVHVWGYLRSAVHLIRWIPFVCLRFLFHFFFISNVYIVLSRSQNVSIYMSCSVSSSESISTSFSRCFQSLNGISSSVWRLCECNSLIVRKIEPSQ